MQLRQRVGAYCSVNVLRGYGAALAAAAALLFGVQAASSATTVATFPAAVASPDAYGAEAAAQILRTGGNAVDAAVAVAFTLAVSYPEAGNLGGGGFATVFFDSKPYFLDYRERAPRAATVNMYLDAAGNVIPDASTIGARAAAVPGTVRGLWELHQRFGRLPWRTDLGPAIRLAQRGFVVSRMLEESRIEAQATFGTRTNFSQYFGTIKAGASYRQPQLATTLQRIAADGPAEFYEGRTAGLIIAEVRRSGGLIDREDLATYQAVWRVPLEADWQGYRIITAPLPSSGGIGLISLLKMKVSLAATFQGVPQNSAQYVHLLAELEKRVFADRAEYFGDPDFSSAPVAELLSTSYLERRAHEISIARPTPTPGVTPGIGKHHSTTHFCIVDRWGNAVSNTYTLNDDFGAGLVVTGAGFLLNNEMDDFSAKPGTPNLYGVVGADANAIAPGKRPLSSMTPTILTRDGRVALVIGTPGGSRIFTSIFQVITNWHDFQMPLAAAVGAVRIHHQLLPPNTVFEEPYSRLDPATRDALIARGYRFETQGWNGDITVVAIASDHVEALADPRGRGVGRVIPSE